MNNKINNAYTKTSCCWSCYSRWKTIRYWRKIEGTLPIINVNVTEMYDPEMDKWTILHPIPAKISGIIAASINNTIYVFGG